MSDVIDNFVLTYILLVILYFVIFSPLFASAMQDYSSENVTVDDFNMSESLNSTGLNMTESINFNFFNVMDFFSDWFRFHVENWYIDVAIFVPAIVFAFWAFAKTFIHL